MMMKRLVQVVAALAGVLAVTTGCAQFSVERLPAPGAGRGSWPLHIDFDTVMNLPTEAKVTVNGLRSGTVADITSARDSAKVTVRLEPSTVVGRDATVELRQDTLLGDTYVAITNPADSYSNRMPHGGTISKDKVKPPVQVEALLNSLANFVGGGSLPQLGNTFDRVVNQFPKDPEETRRASKVLVGTLNALAANQVHLKSMLSATGDIGGKLAAMEAQLKFVLSAEGMQMVDAVTVPAQIVELLSRLGAGLAPMLPAVPVIQALAQVIDRIVKPLLIPGWPDYFGQASNPQALLNVFTDRLIPFLKAGPAVNVGKVAIENDVSDPQLADTMLRQMRMMGLVR